MTSSTIVLDVEGVLFKTRISTLTSVKGSYFHTILSKDWEKHLNRDGHLFVDRDSSIFPIILNFHRDGTSIPLPQDEYFLSRIAQEARFFRLYDLCDIVERKLSYAELPIRYSVSPSTSQRNSHDSKHSAAGQKEKEKLRKENSNEPQHFVKSPSPTIPVLNDYSKRLSVESLLIPMKKSALEKRLSKKRNNAESISLPRNFAHVAHVGWNGNGVIFEKHLLSEQDTVRAIIEAAGEKDLAPIYNMVNGEDHIYGSHSLEVFLTGPHIQAKEKENREKYFYSMPQKRPPKPAIKPPPPPPPFERPASK